MAEIAILIGVVLVGLVVVSHLVEGLRPAPRPPDRLDWAPEIPIRYIAIDDDVRVRYIVAGEGPAVVLLHTLRTQLDLFQKVIPALARRFRVYALDYPGHGYSDIPRADYSAGFFVGAVARVLDRLEIDDATLVGESIGGTIALLLAARRNPRVRRVVAINPYDYDRGRGLRRSSALARLVVALNDVPILGETFTRLRMYPIVKNVLDGGVRRKGALRPALARALYRVGNRRGHYRAFMALLRNGAGWERARAEYRSIDRPVFLLYGDRDWSRPAERDATARAIPNARTTVVADAGHFLSLDAPEEIVRAVTEAADAARP